MVTHYERKNLFEVQTICSSPVEIYIYKCLPSINRVIYINAYFHWPWVHEFSFMSLKLILLVIFSELINITSLLVPVTLTSLKLRIFDNVHLTLTHFHGSFKTFSFLYSGLFYIGFMEWLQGVIWSLPRLHRSQ